MTYRLILVLALSLTIAPTFCFAGDAPYFRINGWGLGEISNRLLIYLGDHGYFKTFIPVSGVAKVAYLTIALILAVFTIVRRCRRRHERTKA
jgi:hypothetical protein